MTAQPTIDDDIVQLCYEAMNVELDCWQIVGPLAQDAYQARWTEPADNMLAGAEIAEVRWEFFSTKQHAVAFVQYNGLRAALERYEEIAGNGDVSQPTSAGSEEASTA